MNRAQFFAHLIVMLMVTFAIAPRFAAADPITPERVNTLPADQRAQWEDYLQRSQANARADDDALKAELAANHMTAALKAPEGGDFKMSAKAGDAYFGTDAAKNLADIILSFQAPDGGWSKHTAYSKGPRKPGMQWSSQYDPGQPPHYLCTIDNRSTTEQLLFLANVYSATKRDDCKAAIIKGLDYIYAAQFPNGGWPQTYPLEGKYHDDITFNDDAMTHVMELLKAIDDGESTFAFLDDDHRKKASDALAKGIDCTLKMQIELNGRKTVWCAQHDALTLKASAARKMEPAALSGAESARLLEFLMSIQKPSPEIVAAIQSGLDWFEQAKITGIAKAKVNGKTSYAPTTASTEIYWARFYDLTTGKPIFPGRDEKIYDTFNAMAANNRVGYDFYTTIPNSLVNNKQKKWRKMMNFPNKGSS